jgi:hypothetical protein
MGGFGGVVWGIAWLVLVLGSGLGEACWVAEVGFLVFLPFLALVVLGLVGLVVFGLGGVEFWMVTFSFLLVSPWITCRVWLVVWVLWGGGLVSIVSRDGICLVTGFLGLVWGGLGPFWGGQPS